MFSIISFDEIVVMTFAKSKSTEIQRGLKGKVKRSLLQARLSYIVVDDCMTNGQFSVSMVFTP